MTKICTLAKKGILTKAGRYMFSANDVGLHLIKATADKQRHKRNSRLICCDSCSRLQCTSISSNFVDLNNVNLVRITYWATIVR